MKSTLTKEQENIVKLNMVIPAKEADSAYNSAVSRFSQYVNIDGFRKGKAPKSVIERHVGVDRIRQEALEIILPKNISQAISENNLDIVTQPALTDYKYVPGEDLEVTLEIEVKPEITISSYKGMNVKAQIPTPDEKAFDNALNGFLEQHASMELVLDRPSCATDIVVFDFDGTCNGEKIQGGSAKGYALDLAHSNFIEGFAEQLVGHNIKDEFDIQVTFPQDYHDEKLKGQPATFAIKLNEIKQRVLPELTDEFVKNLGRFSTVDELKKDIQTYIDSQRESIKKSSAENSAFMAVVNNTSVDIPQRMVDREVQSLRQEYAQRIQYQGISMDKYIESQGGETKFTEILEEDAKSRIKNSLIINEIAKVEKISIEQSDFSQRLSQISAMYGVTPQEIAKEFGQNPGFIENISKQILNDKVRSFLVENNNIEYVEVAPEKETVEQK